VERVTAPGTTEAQCYFNETVYDGRDTCHPGGELVLVKRALDRNTLELGDGRTLRLLGIEVPDAHACAGPGATAYTRSLVEGKQVKIHAEPNVGAGRILRYVQFSEGTNSKGQPSYAYDLGNKIVLYGWGQPADDRANPPDVQRAPPPRGLPVHGRVGVPPLLVGRALAVSQSNHDCR
jgi:hypothetical protein